MNDVPIRVLRETLLARASARPSGECLDPEIVAAWTDDTLPPEDRAAAEAHAAGCARCQALLAAMAKMTPPTATRSWWRGPVIGWLVPLTAAAAVLLMWMDGPRRAPAPSTPVTSREVKQEAAQPEQAAVSSARPAASVPPPARQDIPKAAGKNRNDAPAAQANARVDAVTGIGGTIVPPASQPAPATEAVALPPRFAAESAAPAEARAPLQLSPAAVAGAAKGPALRVDASRSTRLIVSSDLNSRWRITSNGAVQHSTDSGSTWETQSTGVTALLAAGASPSPSICWLVGPEGIVLLSTDGRSWQRIAFPETADLISVRARGDKSATVATSDGRAFTTTDGGLTWTRTAAF